MKPYYADDSVTLYHGDCRDILPTLAITADCIVTDPPYGMLRRPDRGVGEWDIWPKGWPSLAASITNSMWCFGKLRTLLDRRDEFAGWRFSHDVVWSKGAGTDYATDRFRPSHELITHWYRGPWGEIHKAPLRLASNRPFAGERKAGPNSPGVIAHMNTRTEWVDDGTRLALSVIESRNLAGRGIHSTEKPVPVLDQLIRYGCPPGGLIVDLFAGSCSTGIAARQAGRRAVLFEADEAMCEKAVRLRLAQDVLPIPDGGRPA